MLLTYYFIIFIAIIQISTLVKKKKKSMLNIKRITCCRSSGHSLFYSKTFQIHYLQAVPKMKNHLQNKKRGQFLFESVAPLPIEVIGNLKKKLVLCRFVLYSIEGVLFPHILILLMCNRSLEVLCGIIISMCLI